GSGRRTRSPARDYQARRRREKQHQCRVCAGARAPRRTVAQHAGPHSFRANDYCPMRTLLRLATLMLCAQLALAGPTSTALRDTSEWIVKKFGAGVAGRTADEVAV